MKKLFCTAVLIAAVLVSLPARPDPITPIYPVVTFLANGTPIFGISTNVLPPVGFPSFINKGSGGGSGTVGPGTVNKIAKFTAATTVGDSACSENGSLFTCTVPIESTASTAWAFNSGTLGYGTEMANEGATGTTVNKLAKATGAPSTAIITATTDVRGILGVVTDGAGTTGSAVIVYNGNASCVFDSATTAGNAVVNDTSTAGDCMDAGTLATACAASSQVLGIVTTTNAGAGTYNVFFGNPCEPGGGGGGLGYTLTWGYSDSNWAPADSVTVYWAGQNSLPGGTWSTQYVIVPEAGNVDRWNCNWSGTIGTNETFTMGLATGAAGATTFGTDAAASYTSNYQRFGVSGFSQAVSAGDFLAYFVTGAPWSTNPSNVRVMCTIHVSP